MAFSTYLANALLDHTMRNVAYTSPTTVYVGLFTTMPTAAGGGVEVSGGSYARQPVTMTAAASGTTWNSAPLSFPSMPAADLLGAGLFDAATAGNLLLFGPFPTSVSVEAATDFDTPIGDVVGVIR